MLHLVKRFFGHLTARSLTPDECELVTAVLPPDLVAIFDAMCRADQRHSFTVWMRTDARPDLAQAALLHDVGKIGGPDGAVARSLATALVRLRLPLPGRWKIYRDHGSIGSEVLALHGADPLAVAFAKLHPSRAPQGFRDTDWALLLEADNM